MGIDPAYGSSAFGIVVTQWEDNHIQILHAEEYRRPDYYSSTANFSIGSQVGNGAFLSSLYFIISSGKSMSNIIFLPTYILDLGTSNL
jgi:hypothetical protein